MTAGLPRGSWAPEGWDRGLSSLICTWHLLWAQSRHLPCCLLNEYLEKEREKGKGSPEG